MTDLGLGFYNLESHRLGRAAVELRALVPTVQVLGGCEGLGNTLPHVPGYALMTGDHRRSRQNVFAYVHSSLEVSHVRWLDLHETWHRTKGPGEHEARSYLLFHVTAAAGRRSGHPAGQLARVALAIAHQPPRFTDNTGPAQWEGINALSHAMAPWTRPGLPNRLRLPSRLRPRAVLWDSNRRPGEGDPGPDTLARRIGGSVVGNRIDNAVIRRATAVDVEYPESVKTPRGIVHLESDHGHAFRFTLRVPALGLA